MAVLAIEDVGLPVVAATDNLAALVHEADVPHPGLLGDRNFERLYFAKTFILKTVDGDSVDGVRETHGAFASVDAGTTSVYLQFWNEMNQNLIHLHVRTDVPLPDEFAATDDVSGTTGVSIQHLPSPCTHICPL
jgi:hypothetical protein